MKLWGLILILEYEKKIKDMVCHSGHAAMGTSSEEDEKFLKYVALWTKWSAESEECIAMSI